MEHLGQEVMNVDVSKWNIVLIELVFERYYLRRGTIARLISYSYICGATPV